MSNEKATENFHSLLGDLKRETSALERVSVLYLQEAAELERIDAEMLDILLDLQDGSEEAIERVTAKVAA